MLKKFQLKTRMMILICSVVFLAFGITIAFITIKAGNMAKLEAFDKAEEIAYRYSAEVKNQMDIALDASRTISSAFTAIKQSNTPDRDTLDNILINVIKDYPDWMGVWACLEPDALDGRDNEFVNAPGHNDKGRYLPWWNRLSGSVTVAPSATPEPTSPWYQNPFKTGKEYVTDPYMTSKGVMAIDVCTPINFQGKRIGVNGIDFSMEYFKTLLGKIKPFDTGYAFLVTNTGMFVSHPKEDLVGKTMDEINPSNKVMGSIGQGREATEYKASELTGATSFVFYAPVPLGRSGQAWSLGVSIPMEKVLTDVHNLRNMSILIGLLFLGVIVLVIYFIARGITTPISRIAGGLNQGADQVSAASGEVADSSQSLAQGSSQQAAAIEETASSLEEMSSMTNQNAGNAGQANTLMQENSDIIQRAGIAMNTLTQAMQDISNASDETSKIIKTIDEIAFQTNLLALNAAVEAARAGESGAGFAVVADEVRNLALRAAEAAKNTADLIQGTSAKVQEGSTLVDTTSQAFAKVNASTEKMGHLVAEIAAASQEQAQGIGQINQGVSEMDKVVQQNAANAEESASASEEMNAQAHEMKNMVNQLVTLLNGSNGKNFTDTSPRYTERTRTALPAARKPVRKKTIAPAPPRAKQLSSLSPGTREVRPNHELPDDGDFEDF